MAGVAEPAPAPPVTKQLAELPGLVRFSHTIFALPFAFAGALLAARTQGAWPPAAVWGWIVAAMVLARTAAMGFNRLADRTIDAANPRTEGRHLPAGKVTPAFVTGVVACCAVGFVAVSYAINPLCGRLSPVALLFVLGYSFMKRVTAFAHMVLGLALACAPIGAWLAVTGAFHAAPLWLGGAVLLWVSGFDIIYATMDTEYDQQAGLHSMPSRLGVARALKLAALLHLLTVGAFVGAGWAAGLGWPYYTGVGLAAALLAYEHAIVKPDDLGRVNAAFFNANAVISVLILAAVGADWWLS
ncbi:MAG: UbiA-like polyprenyltransferase [Planctomycetota bacterium]